MGTVTKSIGTTGRDYSTITLWEADLDNVAVYASGDHAVGECYNDSEFDEAVTINGGGTVGLASVTLTVASGHRHDGTAGTGASLVSSAARAWTVNTTRTTIIEWLELDANEKASGSPLLELISGNGYEKRVQRLILHGQRRNSTSSCQTLLTTRRPTYIHECIVYDGANISSGNAEAVTFANGAGSDPMEAYNLTIHDFSSASGGSGIGLTIEDLAGRTAKNNAATDCDTCFSPASPATATLSYNLSSDTTASGTGSLTSKASANQFVSTVAGSEDLHLKAGADCIDAGTDLGTTPTGVNIDIDGRDRDASGDVWDIGADEYVAIATGSTAYILGGGVF